MLRRARAGSWHPWVLRSVSVPPRTSLAPACPNEGSLLFHRVLPVLKVLPVAMVLLVPR